MKRVLAFALFAWLSIFSAAALAQIHVSSNESSALGSDGLIEQGWSPVWINGTIVWLRSDQGITRVSGVVSAWADYSSGSSNSASQGTAGNRPGYQASGGANNRPYLTFVGGGGTHTLLGTVLPAQPQEFFIVARSTASNPAQNNYLFDTGGNVSSTIQGSGTNSLEQYSGSAIVNVTSFTSGSDFLVDSYFNGAASEVAINGGTTTGPANPGTNPPTLGYTVGAENLPTDEWGGFFYEAVVQKALVPAPQRSWLLMYFSNLYGGSI